MDIKEANRLIDLLGRQTKIELSNRGKLETVLFPNSLYESLAAIEIFYRYPGFLRAISRKASPEEIGRTCVKYGNDVTTMQVWTIGLEFLWGRQLLLTLGVIGPGDYLNETLEALDFWKRVNLAYRGDGNLCNGQAGHVNPLLSAEEVRRFSDESKPLSEEQKTLFRRLHAKALSLLILMNCESRAKYSDSGPYDVGDGEKMLLTDFVDLDGSSYPWGIPGALPFNHLTMAIVLKDVRLRIANAGLAYGRPPNFVQNVTRAAVYTSDRGKLKPFGPELWSEAATALSSAQTRLYRKFAAMDQRDRVMAGTTTYFWFIKPLARFVGVESELDWSLRHALDFYDALKEPGFADDLFERTLILPREAPSSYTPLAE